MKKLMFATAVAAAGLAYGVESSNVVGFNTKTLEAGKFAIAAFQFEATDGTLDINKIVSGLAPASYAEYGNDFVNVAPQVQIPKATGNGYDYYYYLSDGYYIDEQGKEAEKPGWCDSSGTIAGDDEAGALVTGELIPGVAVWVKDVQNAGTAQIAGQVPADASVTVSTPATFVLRANAYPTAFDLNNTNAVTFAGLTPASYAEYGNDFVNYAPQIQVPKTTGNGYDYYYYLSDGYYIDEQGKEAEKLGWCDSSGTIAGDDEAGALVSGIVPAGSGFWAKGVGSAFTITFKK